jgi:hypothetical protein
MLLDPEQENRTDREKKDQRGFHTVDIVRVIEGPEWEKLRGGSCRRECRCPDGRLWEEEEEVRC